LIGWQVYAWLFSALLLFSAFGRAVLFHRRPGLVSRLDLVEAGLGVAAIPALFGFAYERAYGSQVLWAALALALIVLSIYQFFTPKMQKIYSKGMVAALGVIILQIVLGAPALWALIRYSFLERRLWR
jgi:hypothetical protein